MKNLVRGGVLLMLLGVFVAIVYAQTRSEDKPTIANDSQQQLNKPLVEKEVISNQNSTSQETDKKFVKTTGLVTSAKSAGLISRGSFSMTAYCLRGKTALGHSVRRGLVAADPRVLRLGSKIQIEGGGYSGTYLVSDTGGSVRGRELDLWVPSCTEARRFGRRNVSVFLLPN